MNQSESVMKSWKEKANYLLKLIKKLSDQHGGDEEIFLKEYGNEVIKKYAAELEVAIECFEELIGKEAKCVIESQRGTCGATKTYMHKGN